MTPRERFLALMHYKPVDRLFGWEMSGYPETYKRWRKEGMPADQHMADIAGYDRLGHAPAVMGMMPGFDYEEIEFTQEYVIYRDGDGVLKKKIRNLPPPAMPQYLDYPLKTRKDWKEFKKRLNPDSPARVPAHWGSLVKEYNARDYPLGISAGSMYGWLRNWMGYEHMAMMLYDDPKWIREMMDHIADVVVTVLKKVVADVKFDFASMWEDMAYKTGPLISPEHVREFMVPGYKRIVEVLHRAGVDIIMLDSDGNVDKLIPIWLECGINLIYPFEVAAGMDVVALRRKFGKDLLMAGGMDKRIMAADKRSIKKMVYEKADLMKQGAYIPGCDHAIPPDVSWENFLYYRKVIREIGG